MTTTSPNTPPPAGYRLDVLRGLVSIVVAVLAVRTVVAATRDEICVPE